MSCLQLQKTTGEDLEVLVASRRDMDDLPPQLGDAEVWDNNLSYRIVSLRYLDKRL
jgi:hypothetical protein